MKTPSQLDQATQDLLELIELTQNVSVKIHGVQAEAEIFRLVKEEFARSKRYIATILLFTEDRSALRLAHSSLSSSALEAMERVGGTIRERYRIDLNKSATLRQVAIDGITLKADGGQILGELFPKALAQLLVKVMGLGKQPSILTPLSRHQQMVGVLSVSAPQLAEPFVPSVRNLAHHISTELELARESADREQAQAALQASEARFRHIFQSVTDGISVMSLEGTIVEANDRAARIHGYSTKDEYVGKSFRDLLAPDELERATSNLARALADGSTRVVEYTLRRVDQTSFPAEISVNLLLDPAGKPQGVIATTRDITERKQAEKRILQHNRELTALNQIAQTISQSIDLDEILNNALDRTLAILNIRHGSIHLKDREEDHLTMKIHRGLAPDKAAAYSTIKSGRGLVGNMPKLQDPVFVESLGSLDLTPEGRDLVAAQDLGSAIFVPLKTRGEVLGMLCAVTTADRVFTEEDRGLLITIGHQISTAIENVQLIERESRARALEELDKLRAAFLASVSHELRTPLTSIKGLASCLIQPDVQWDTETQQDYLRIINRQADILTHIIGDLIQMSQIEAGVMTMDRKPTDLAVLMAELKGQLSDLANDHDLEITVTPDLPPVFADDIRIGEVITNLVSNAAAYSDPGSRITLKATRLNGNLFVSVTDEGVGIPAKHLDRVFDRFYRLETGVARRRGGTGLGLSICKGIVEGHDGEIWVESKEGTGSTFSFTIPIAPNTPIREEVGISDSVHESDPSRSH